jgi:hypothetical protein
MPLLLDLESTLYSQNDLTQARSEIADLKSTIKKMEYEIRNLRSELRVAGGDREPSWKDWEEMGDISDVCRPTEWTLELVELVLRVFCDYCWANVLSESQRNELCQAGIQDCVFLFIFLDLVLKNTQNTVEALYRYADQRNRDFAEYVTEPAFRIKNYDAEPALRIFWNELPVTSTLVLLQTRDNFLEFPRPYFACRRDRVQRYSESQIENFHLSTLSPPIKAAFKRFIYANVAFPPPIDIISSAEGLWDV